MPPNKGDQPRRGNAPRRTAEPRTSNTQGNDNAVRQPPIPQPAQTQSSTRQSPNMANQDNAQRPSQQPVSMIAGLSYSDVLQNNQNQIQRSGQAPLTPARSSARQSFNVADRNRSQGSKQQSVPMIDPVSRRDSLQISQNSTQNSGETPRTWSAVVTGDLSRPPRYSSPASNQAKPETKSSLEHVGHPRASTSKEADIPNVANSSSNANTTEDPDVSEIYRYILHLKVFLLMC